MASTIYSTRFGAKHDMSISDPLIFTVPAGFRAVIRDIDVYYGGLTGNTFIALLDETPQVVFWQDSVAIGESGWRSWRGRQVLLEGESCTLSADDVCDVMVSGYLLVEP